MKDNFKLLNNIDMDLDKYEDLNIDKDKLKKKMRTQIKTKNKFKKNKLKKLIIASSVCVSISIVTLSNDRVWAVFGNIGRQIEQYFGKKENEFNGYKVSINESVEDKGIKMTLYEVLLDDGQILLSMNMDHSQFDESSLKKGLYKHKNYYWNKASVYIDNKKFILDSTSTIFEKEKEKKQDFLSTISLTSIDNNDDGYADIENYQLLDNIDVNKDYEMKVVFEEIGIHQVGLLPGAKYDNFIDIDGKWEFNFIVNGHKIKDETKTYDINKNIKLEDEGFKAELDIKMLRISPVSTKLIYNIKMGEGYEFENRYIDIELQDQDGNIIGGGSSGGGNAEGTYMNMELNVYQSDINKLSSIKIVPYQYYREKDSTNPKYNHIIKYEDKAINLDIK
ncbi:DUF4179 domain-containing protein [Romboutsia ilealis]|uniref:DUF4179 domain-containing protein n=1 Tax=Romboutsia ilealis TaxID=1115758 RepID=A0A1V1I0M1_9FIRM|nr:DUF4179 domain-containing protein [Romboutsia ilealis]CED93792.1 Domain of unknown function (DUF4179) [Romboutsia ilealis]